MDRGKPTRQNLDHEGKGQWWSREEIQEQKVKGRKRWRGRAGSAATTKASGSENETMLAHRRLFISDIRKQQCTRELKGKVPAAALGVLGCRQPPQDQRLGFSLALWLLSNVRRITTWCRAFGHKHTGVHGTESNSTSDDCETAEECGTWSSSSFCRLFSSTAARLLSSLTLCSSSFFLFSSSCFS